MIDLNTRNQINIQFTQFINKTTNIKINNESSIKAEILKSNNSISLLYQHPNTFTSGIFNISGPYEARLKFKTKTEEAYIEVLTTFNFDIDKSKQQIFNEFIKNYCESIIKTDDYPRCVISININILSYPSENELKRLLTNGLIASLSLSGINMASTAFSTIIETESSIESKQEVLVCLDADENILFIESQNPIKISSFNDLLSKAKANIKEVSSKMKRLILSLINNQ